MFRQGTGHYLILKESTEKQDFNIPGFFFNVHVTINNARAMKKKRHRVDQLKNYNKDKYTLYTCIKRAFSSLLQTWHGAINSSRRLRMRFLKHSRLSPSTDQACLFQFRFFCFASFVSLVSVTKNKI